MWIYSASKYITMQNVSDANGIALILHSSSFYSGTLLTRKDISISILGLCSRWNIIHGYHIRWNILGSANRTGQCMIISSHWNMCIHRASMIELKLDYYMQQGQSSNFKVHS